MIIAYIGQKGIPVKFGGIEKHVEELATGLAQNGHKVFVYVRPYYTPKALKIYHGVNLIHLPSIKTKHLDAISHTFFATIHALFYHYDIIHYHGVGPALLSFIPRILKPKCRVIVTFHCLDREHAKWGWLARKVLTLGEKAACYFPHETIVVSQSLKEYCLINLKKEAVYIPNGVGLPLKPKEPATLAFLNKKNLEPRKYFIIVSRLIPHKKIEEALNAFAALFLKDYKLVIVGDGFFTENYVASLKRLAKQFHNIVFLGNRQCEELAALYSQALAYLAPSGKEGLSFGLLEALSYGLPAIVKDIPENRGFIKDKIVESYQTPIQLEEKMRRLIKQAPAYLNQAALRQNYIAQNFSSDQVIRATEELYYRLFEDTVFETSKLKV
jgi:glycosyltransferase involved in cell wall biosynthesis